MPRALNVQVNIQAGLEGEGFVQTLKAAAEATIQDQGLDNRALTVVLTDEPGICSYNRNFAGLDAPTDVLSFPDGEADPESGQVYLGDVIVCPPVALKGAAAARHSLVDELCLLTVHGVLHLLDYDHGDPNSRARMWEAQERILQRLGVTWGS